MALEDTFSCFTSTLCMIELCYSSRLATANNNTSKSRQHVCLQMLSAVCSSLWFANALPIKNPAESLKPQSHRPRGQCLAIWQTLVAREKCTFPNQLATSLQLLWSLVDWNLLSYLQTHVKYSLGSSKTVKSVTQTRNAFTLLLIYRQTFYFSSIALFHIFLSLGLYLACHCWCSPLFVTTFTSWQPYLLLPDCTGNTSPSQDICIKSFHWLTAALDRLNKCK